MVDLKGSIDTKSIWVGIMAWAERTQSHDEPGNRRIYVSSSLTMLSTMSGKHKPNYACIYITNSTYRQISNRSRTKSQNLNVSRLVLQSSVTNLLEPGVKSRMKM